MTFCLLGINMVNTINHYMEKRGERLGLKTSGKNKLQKKRKIRNAGILEEKAWDHGLRWWKEAKRSRLSDLSLKAFKSGVREGEQEGKRLPNLPTPPPSAQEQQVALTNMGL